jgi:acetyl-CoA carboxylase carboxyltransferase component
MSGRPVGILASNPMFHAGALTPDACDKGTLFLCLCDAFNLPMIFLTDTPGFMVGKQAEHDRLAARAMMFCEALLLSRMPRLTVVIRKAFGQAFFNMNGPRMGEESIVAWPSAQISFMDPEVGVNVIYADEIAKADNPAAERKRLAESWRGEIQAEHAAAIMEIDEIIDPAETRAWLCRYVSRMKLPIPQKGDFKPLAFWPTCL